MDLKIENKINIYIAMNKNKSGINAIPQKRLSMN